MDKCSTVLETEEKGVAKQPALSPHRDSITYSQITPIFHPGWVTYAQESQFISEWVWLES